MAGCTGFSLGENTPGGDTWTDPPPTNAGEHHVGAIAVERDEDQLWVVHEENRAGTRRAHLAAIDPTTRVATDVLDVSTTTDRRVVFPSADRMLLMAQSTGTETLVLFDTTTRTPIRSTTKSAYYWGTRTAPSGRAVVVADNDAPGSPLHVIDLATLEHQVLPHGGDLVEAMWNHHGDVLLALSVTAPFTDHPVARLLRYDFTGADLGAPLPEPTVAWELAGYDWDFLFSFTWIGISPDDRWAVFPLVQHVPSDLGTHVLLVLDQTTGRVTLESGSGPVGFTRDGTQIVSYGTSADGNGQDLWLIDPVARTRTVAAMPFAGGISYFPMRDSDHIVVAPAFPGTEPIAVYDAATGALRQSTREGVGLGDFVVRPGKAQLFAETAGDLFAIGLADAAVFPVPTSARIGNLNVRPSADQLLATDAGDAVIYRIDMATRALQPGGALVLPSPFASHPAALPAGSGALRPRGAGRLTTRREHDGDATAL